MSPPASTNPSHHTSLVVGSWPRDPQDVCAGLKIGGCLGKESRQRLYSWLETLYPRPLDDVYFRIEAAPLKPPLPPQCRLTLVCCLRWLNRRGQLSVTTWERSPLVALAVFRSSLRKDQTSQ